MIFVWLEWKYAIYPHAWSTYYFECIKASILLIRTCLIFTYLLDEVSMMLVLTEINNFGFCFLSINHTS